MSSFRMSCFSVHENSECPDTFILLDEMLFGHFLVLSTFRMSFFLFLRTSHSSMYDSNLKTSQWSKKPKNILCSSSKNFW